MSNDFGLSISSIRIATPLILSKSVLLSFKYHLNQQTHQNKDT